MTGRIGAKGQVVIPKAIRDRANLHPGDEVDKDCFAVTTAATHRLILDLAQPPCVVENLCG